MAHMTPNPTWLRCAVILSAVFSLSIAGCQKQSREGYLEALLRPAAIATETSRFTSLPDSNGNRYQAVWIDAIHVLDRQPSRREMESHLGPAREEHGTVVWERPCSAPAGACPFLEASAWFDAAGNLRRLSLKTRKQGDTTYGKIGIPEAEARRDHPEGFDATRSARAPIAPPAPPASGGLPSAPDAIALPPPAAPPPAPPAGVTSPPFGSPWPAASPRAPQAPAATPETWASRARSPLGELGGGIGGPVPQARPQWPSSSPAPRPSYDPQAAWRQAGELAFQQALALDTPTAYQQYLRQYSNHPRAAAVRNRLGDLAFAWATQQETVQAYEQFLQAFPDHARAREARTRRDAIALDLEDLLQAGAVTVTARGSGLGYVLVIVERQHSSPMRIAIPAGTYFAATGRHQDMVTTKRYVVDLTERASETISVHAACAQFSAAIPDSADGFIIAPHGATPELRRLAEVIDARSPSSRAAQVAVWALTDDPSRSELDGRSRSVPVGSIGSFGQPAADDEDLREARALLEAAGIPPSGRRLFR